MIHILTLTWNGLDKLQRLLPTLEKAAAPLEQDVKWYIRDNGSKDGTVEWLKNISSEHLSFHKLLVNHNRDNFAQGVNSLYNKIENKSDDDFVLLLNNDIEFADDVSLSNMVNLMQSDDEIGMVGARLLYNGTNKLQHAGVIFGKMYGNMPYHFRHKETSDKFSEKNRYFQAVTAACCLVRMRDFELMDEKFSWAFEDIDLCLRIGKKRKIVYCGQTKIYHEESASLKKNPVNKLFLNKNVRHFKKKWNGKYELDHEKYLKNKDYKVYE